MSSRIFTFSDTDRYDCNILEPLRLKKPIIGCFCGSDQNHGTLLTETGVSTGFWAWRSVASAMTDSHPQKHAANYSSTLRGWNINARIPLSRNPQACAHYVACS